MTPSGSGNHFRVFLLLLLVLLADHSDAFASQQKNLAQIRNCVHPHTHAVTPSQRSTKTLQTPPIVPALFAGKKGADDGSKAKKDAYAGVEDGSPLGVAIVLLGSLLVFGSGDDALRSPDSPAPWIVLATASAAAGLARLFRYFRDKDA